MYYGSLPRFLSSYWWLLLLLFSFRSLFATAVGADAFELCFTERARVACRRALEVRSAFFRFYLAGCLASPLIYRFTYLHTPARRVLKGSLCGTGILLCLLRWITFFCGCSVTGPYVSRGGVCVYSANLRSLDALLKICCLPAWLF